MKWIWLAYIALTATEPKVVQQRFDPPPAPTTHAELLLQPVPVTSADITDRPYRVIGEIRAEVGSFTTLSRRPSREAHIPLTYGDRGAKQESCQEN